MCKKRMDQTAYCRDRCASSSDMLACVADCLKRPTLPVRSQPPKLIKIDDSQKKIIGTVAVIGIVVGAIWWMKKHKKA